MTSLHYRVAVSTAVLLLATAQLAGTQVVLGSDTKKSSLVPVSQKSPKAKAKTRMSACMDAWDRATQMSKQEWRETCKRTVKANPRLFDDP